MRVVSKEILQLIILQHLARSVVADTESVLIESRPGQEPNWAIVSHDRVVQIIAADLQTEYALDEGPSP